MDTTKVLLLNIILLSTLLSCVRAFTRIGLNGDGWLVTNSSGVKLPSRVPGSVYSALIDNGYLEDPLYRDNDVKYAWVGLTNWTYIRTFSVPAEVLSAKQVWLVFEGLDTIADVLLNGKVVGHSDNMFVRSKFNVTGIVKSDSNDLTVNFYSPVEQALARVKRTAYNVPPDCPPSVQNGQCHVNQIRKEQCSFSWDWGPSFPTQGIWKPVFLDAYNTSTIRQISAVTVKTKNQWELHVDTFLDLAVDAEIKGQLIVSVPGLNLTYKQDVTVSPANDSFRLILPVPVTTTVPLWWPSGYGSQPLFDLSVLFTSGTDSMQMIIRIGFRTVELVQDPVTNRTEDGLSFYYRINGVPVFLKGSNWIPADSFQERITHDRLRFLLESAKNVSINSMRVWGGGVYESDEFYQLCDELGILIWQDFMFSVALYPVYQEFLDSVAVEVRHQVRRLKHHPSVLVWAGNNENEAGLRQNWFGTADNYTLYYNNYVQLYVKTIKPIVQQEDPTRDYLTSSPSDGEETEKEGYVAQDPGSELYGDIHFYDYAVDQWNASSFKIPRMASEYGVQAWCNNESLANVFIPEDFDRNSAMVNHRQHHGGGNLEMAAEVGLHLNLPNSPDEKANFVDFIYLTQINQAMCIRTQSEHYRRSQTVLLPDGRGLTMGALYWQLNDIWQAPTWASIDYEGNWKMLHYYIRSFFKKALISPYLKDGGNTLDVFMVLDEVPVSDVRSADGKLSFQLISSESDLAKIGVPAGQMLDALTRVNRLKTGFVTLDIYQYKSFGALHSWNTSYSLKTPAESVFSKKVSDLLSESGCPSVADCLLYLQATDQTGAVISSSWYPLAYPKFSRLVQAHVKITSVELISPHRFSIQLSSDAIALYVWLSAANITGHFSDNGFAMLTPTVQVYFYAREDVTVPELASALQARSVTDVTSF